MPPAPPPPPAPRPRWEQHAVFGAASTVCALFLVRVIVLFYQKDYGRAVDAARGVVTGHPHWRVYQSRVLGPWLVELLAHLFPSFLAAHVAFSFLTLAAAGFLVLTFTQRQYGDAGRSWAAFFMFQSLFVFLMSRPRVLGLFAVAIFNRESALLGGPNPGGPNPGRGGANPGRGEPGAPTRDAAEPGGAPTRDAAEPGGPNPGRGGDPGGDPGTRRRPGTRGARRGRGGRHPAMAPPPSATLQRLPSH